MTCATCGRYYSDASECACGHPHWLTEMNKRLQFEKESLASTLAVAEADRDAAQAAQRAAEGERDAMHEYVATALTQQAKVAWQNSDIAGSDALSAALVEFLTRYPALPSMEWYSGHGERKQLVCSACGHRREIKPTDAPSVEPAACSCGYIEAA